MSVSSAPSAAAWLLGSLLYSLVLCAQARDDFRGEVIKVFDGDSFLVRSSRGVEIDVRLLDIDAPEKSQPYGSEARQALQALIGGRDVFIDVIDEDHYGRVLARVYREPDRLDVTRTLVHDAHVWVYRRTARDRSLISLEDAARAEGRGLWSRPKSELIPPWRFRYLERQKKRSEQPHEVEKKPPNRSEPEE